MIIEEIDESLFISRFEDFKRVKTLEHSGNFSYKGLRALFKYLDDSFDESDPYTLDVIALCCEYSEYGNVDEYLTDYPLRDEFKEEYDNDEKRIKEAIEEDLNDNTTLIKFSDDLDEGFIIQAY
jgi:hypothetical protein